MEQYMEILRFFGSMGGAALLTHFFNRSKQQAEVSRIVVEVYDATITSLRSEIERLKMRIGELESRIQLFKRRAS